MNAKEKCIKVPRYKCNKEYGLGCLGCKTYIIYSTGYQNAKSKMKKIDGLHKRNFEELIKHRLVRIILKREIDFIDSIPLIFKNYDTHEEYIDDCKSADCEPLLKSKTEFDLLKEYFK